MGGGELNAKGGGGLGLFALLGLLLRGRLRECQSPHSPPSGQTTRPKQGALHAKSLALPLLPLGVCLQPQVTSNTLFFLCYQPLHSLRRWALRIVMKGRGERGKGGGGFARNVCGGSPGFKGSFLLPLTWKPVERPNELKFVKGGREGMGDNGKERRSGGFGGRERDRAFQLNLTRAQARAHRPSSRPACGPLSPPPVPCAPHPSSPSMLSVRGNRRASAYETVRAGRSVGRVRGVRACGHPRSHDLRVCAAGRWFTVCVQRPLGRECAPPSPLPRSLGINRECV